MLFLLYTIFPNPLRLYVDTLHAPIVDAGRGARADAPRSATEVEAFRREFTARAKPIREHRRRHRSRLRRREIFAGHVRRRLGEDRDNEYLRPWRLLARTSPRRCARRAARPFYDRLGAGRPFVYFPLHVTDDYKIKRIIPHCVDQASLVEQIADALPRGPRPRAQGAPDVDRPQLASRCSGGCAGARTSGCCRPVRELARPDPRAPRRSR